MDQQTRRKDSREGAKIDQIRKGEKEDIEGNLQRRGRSQRERRSEEHGSMEEQSGDEAWRQMEDNRRIWQIEMEQRTVGGARQDFDDVRLKLSVSSTQDRWRVYLSHCETLLMIGFYWCS